VVGIGVRYPAGLGSTRAARLGRWMEQRGFVQRSAGEDTGVTWFSDTWPISSGASSLCRRGSNSPNCLTPWPPCASLPGSICPTAPSPSGRRRRRFGLVSRARAKGREITARKVDSYTYRRTIHRLKRTRYAPGSIGGYRGTTVYLVKHAVAVLKFVGMNLATTVFVWLWHGPIDIVQD
jgi:hypothetical protein